MSRTVWGPGNIGPVDLDRPADQSAIELIAVTANAHPNWGPLRIAEELRDGGAYLTDANVHWVLCEYALRDYS